MGLGQGIQNAGNLFAQAILSKHEEEQRLRREALAQQNLEAQQRLQRDQFDRAEANDLYNRSWDMVQASPDGRVISGEQRNSLDPTVRDFFTSPQMELPQRDIGMGRTLEAPQETGRYTVQAPYRQAEAVAKINATRYSDVEQERTRRALAVAEVKRAATEYQQLQIQLGKERNATARAALQERIRHNRAIIAAADDRNLLDEQTRYDLGIDRIRSENPDFQPSSSRPTAKTPKTGTSLQPFNPAAIDWSK